MNMVITDNLISEYIGKKVLLHTQNSLNGIYRKIARIDELGWWFEPIENNVVENINTPYTYDTTKNIEFYPHGNSTFYFKFLE